MESAKWPLGFWGSGHIRTALHADGLDFAVHADAAWGGYFAAMLLAPSESETKTSTENAPVPVLPMSDYVHKQYAHLLEADTITVDPHKTGYLPYPAGALCYRNKLMRSLVAFEAPYTNPDSNGSTDEGGSKQHARLP